MLSIRLQKNAINVICTNNQYVNCDNLKQSYRTVLKLIKQNNEIPVIVNLDQHVKITRSARNLFKKIESKYNDRTLVIIAG